MKHNVYTPLVLGIVAMALVTAGSAAAKAPLSNAEKLAAVNRMYAEYKTTFPEVRDVTPKVAMEWMKTKPVLFVDTREPEEMAVSMLPGALSREAFETHLDAYRNRVIIAYCTISYRSGIFAEEMARKGITVLNLAGGILAWALEGGTVYDSSGPTKRIHVYGRKWDFAPKGYESVMFGWLKQIF